MADIESGPQDRKMDLTQIEGFGFFLVDNPEERVLYVDRVELIADNRDTLNRYLVSADSGAG